MARSFGPCSNPSILVEELMYSQQLKYFSDALGLCDAFRRIRFPGALQQAGLDSAEFLKPQIEDQSATLAQKKARWESAEQLFGSLPGSCPQ